jgi:hypothetical protein
MTCYDRTTARRTRCPSSTRAGISAQLPARFGQDHPSSWALADGVIGRSGPHRHRSTSRRSPATGPATAGCPGRAGLTNLVGGLQNTPVAAGSPGRFR